jgi:copper resistance protein D
VRTLYLLSVYLHILSATVWVGGIAFVVLVVVPWVRRNGRAIAGPLLSQTGQRFRTIGWTCFAVVLVTGTFNLWFRGVRFDNFADPRWLGSSAGAIIVLKLAVFSVVVLISAVHDFLLGPKATRLLSADPTSPEASLARRRASLLGRLNALFALILVALAVMIVRGTPG